MGCGASGNIQTVEPLKINDNLGPNPNIKPLG